jgi:6-phosphofructokinase 1
LVPSFFEEMQSQRARIGIIHAGGPAPGSNAVIEMATHRCLDFGVDVIGFLGGYKWFEQVEADQFQDGIQYKFLRRSDVAGIRDQGGCVIATSRANPGQLIAVPEDLEDPEKVAPLQKVAEIFAQLGVTAVISIGGDDTLRIANFLHRIGVNIVHVPKTIDNDYFGIPWTFGFFTAAQVGGTILRNLRSDAQTTDAYFICECMGRKSGWLAAATSIYGNASMCVIPEELPPGEMNIDMLANRIVDFILKREEGGKYSGIIAISEGLADRIPQRFRPIKTDKFGNERLGDAEVGKIVTERVNALYLERTGREKKVVAKTIGYETRSASPNSFDVLLSMQLGQGAVTLIDQQEFGHMVTLGEELKIKSIPFEKLIDPATLKVRNRSVDLNSDFYKLLTSSLQEHQV